MNGLMAAKRHAMRCRLCERPALNAEQHEGIGADFSRLLSSQALRGLVRILSDDYTRGDGDRTQPSAPRDQGSGLPVHLHSLSHWGKRRRAAGKHHENNRHCYKSHGSIPFAVYVELDAGWVK